MIIQNHCRKQLVNFLIKRWLCISEFAAMEELYVASCQFAKEHTLPIPNEPDFIQSSPSLQIEIIKYHIVKILPEASFIDYTYESQVPLDPNDFMEICVEDHKQCANKVKSLMKRMKIQ